METKSKILQQTFALIMKYGIKSVSMEDISRNIGISKKTIYQHFDSKKTLIKEVVADHIANDQIALRQIIDNATDAIDEMVLVAQHVLHFLRGMSPSMMFDTRKYYPTIWQMVENQHIGFFLDITRKNILRGQKEGLYLTDINPEIVARIYVHQSLALSDETIFPLSTFTRSELYQAIVTYHIRGIMTDKGREVAGNQTIK